MAKKTLVTILFGALFLALIAFLWWWFLARVPQTLAPAGTFGTAGDKGASGASTLPRTNIALPTISNLGTLPAGTYTFKSTSDGSLQTYTVTPLSQPAGAYTVQPPVPAGQYIVSGPGGQVVGTYTISTNNTLPQSYTITQQTSTTTITTTSTSTVAIATSSPYLGNINTPGVNWFFTASSTNFGSTTIGGDTGTAFNPTTINGVNGSNPQGGLLPNFDANLNGGNKGLGLAAALVGAAAGGAISCLAPYAFDAVGLGAAAGITGTAAVGAGVSGAAAAATVSGATAAAGSTVGNLISSITGASPIAGLSAAEASGDVFLSGGGALGGVGGAGGGVAGGAGGGVSSGGSSASGLASVFTFDLSNAISNIMQSLTLSGILAANTTMVAQRQSDHAKDITDCLFRVIGKAVVRQITTSVVNWINSGFSGSPSFVTNPTQFFTNVADVAAGQFIQGSALSFLCSPFKLQIRIAVAYSYAHRNETSCTLTGITNNVNNFINGSFSAGGWPTFLSFTMTPTNNPYGAYAYAQNGLNTSIANAQNAFSVQLNQGRGFLSLQQKQNCKNQDYLPANVTPDQFVKDIGPSATVSGNSTVATNKNTGGSGSSGNIVISGTSGTVNKQSVSVVSDNKQQGPTPSGGTAGATYEVCDLVTTTPGSVIAGTLEKAIGATEDSLNLAQSFDQVISALLQQLMGQISNGLSNLSQGGNGTANSAYYTPEQDAAQAAGQGLLGQMKTDTTNNQQLGTILQGEIQDIQAGQSQLNELLNCWKAAVTRTQAIVNALQPPAPIDTTTAEGQYYRAYNTDPASIQQFNTASSTAHANLALAQSRVAATTNLIASYESKVTDLNNRITQVNNAIALLEQYESRALSAGSSADIATLNNEYANSSVHIAQTDLTTEQQNRTTLQSTLATLSTNINTSTTQCHAF